MKKVLVFLLIVSVFLFLPKKILAASFSTDYNVTYSIKNDAKTHVNLNVILTNLTDKYYASSYDIQTGFSDIQNPTAYDGEGNIKPEINKTEKGNTVRLTFNQQVLGQNNKLEFNLSFDTEEIAQNFGNVWEVNIPGIASQNDFSSFNVNVVYPSTIGKPTFIKPDLPSALDNIQNNTIKFNKEQLGSSGISLAFGDFQNYEFNLVYHLENKNVFSIRTEIALPPSTNYQDVYINSMTPKPENVYIDEDGNWLASYVISPSKREDVVVKGQAKVFLKPRPQDLSTHKVNEYLKNKDYWQTENKEIIKLATELKTPEKIYNYIVSKLTYDYSRVESESPRLGAVGVLKNPDSAVCLEFTDLFITLARAAGIPAREVEGFAYTDNSNQRPLSLVKDVLHAWPQYYDFDKKTWIMIDPTWGNTTRGVDYFHTLDFDHLAFVIKGKDSTYPIPAGGYKYEGEENVKDVSVSITKSTSSMGTNIVSSIEMANEFIAGFPIKGRIKIENKGDSVFIPDKLYISSDKLTPLTQTLTTDAIPPSGYITVDFSLDKTGILTKIDNTVKIALGESFSDKQITVLPFFLNIWFILGGLLIVTTIFIISVSFIGYRRISFYRQKRRSDLRGQGDQPTQKSL